MVLPYCGTFPAGNYARILKLQQGATIFTQTPQAATEPGAASVTLSLLGAQSAGGGSASSPHNARPTNVKRPTLPLRSASEVTETSRFARSTIPLAGLRRLVGARQVPPSRARREAQRRSTFSMTWVGSSGSFMDHSLCRQARDRAKSLRFATRWMARSNIQRPKRLQDLIDRDGVLQSFRSAECGTRCDRCGIGCP